MIGIIYAGNQLYPRMHGGDVLKYIYRSGLVGIGILIFGLLLLASVGAAEASDRPDIQAAPNAQGIANETCLSCHSSPGMQTTLPSGEVLNLTVDPETFNKSIHGEQGYACVQCHVDISEFPHRL